MAENVSTSSRYTAPHCLGCGSDRIETDYESQVDDYRINEAATLRIAVDHLSHYMADLTDGDGNFCPGWPMQSIAETITYFCEMLAVRERLKEREAQEKEQAEARS